MKIYDYTEGHAIPDKRVIALGFFDGVHKGHRAIIEEAKKIAAKRGLPTAVFTFRAENNRLKNDPCIYSTDKKLSLFESLGVDEVILTDFIEVKDLSAESFISDILVGDFGCEVAVSGKDFRFGKGAMGNTELLGSALSKIGSSLVCPEAIVMDGEKISSSRIKRLLLDGNVKDAGALLGQPYFICSEVKRGLGKGKGFGFPTVNTEISDGEISLPAGVYKCRATVGTEKFDAISNVGVCPTVSVRAKHIETYILNYSGDLYGEKITVEYLDFIRPEKKFSSQEELIMQIKLDINNNFNSEELI